MEWYYTKDDERRGPVDEYSLKLLYEYGALIPADLVWNEDMEDWQPAKKVFGPPSPPRRRAPPSPPVNEGVSETTPLRALVEECLAPLKDARLMLAPNIPKEKMAGARDGMLKGILPGEEVLVIYDDTAMGGCKDGFALTDRRFHWKNMWDDPGAADYADLADTQVKRDWLGNVTVAECSITVSNNKKALAEALALLLRGMADAS